MKLAVIKKIIIFNLILFAINTAAQDKKYSELEIKTKLDSILTEADLLYRYEKSSWTSTDLALANKKTKKEFGRYLTYDSNDTIKTIIIDKELQNCIAEFVSINENGNNSFSTRPLSAKENELLKVEHQIKSQLDNPKYQVTVPEGFSLNMILLPQPNGYKFYIITGTAKSDVIPFGNDYLFETDKQGTIKNYKKFHSRLLAIETKIPNGGKISMVTHSHLKTNPFISATDICTFKLYGKLYDVSDLSIYSPAIGKYFAYNLDTNKIEIKD